MKIRPSYILAGIAATTVGMVLLAAPANALNLQDALAQLVCDLNRSTQHIR